MGTLKLNTTSGGSLSIQAADGASDNTLTLPAVTGGNIVTTADSGTITQGMIGSGVGGSGPAFSVYMFSSAAFTSATSTKVTLDTEVFDTANCFASSRFTPNVSGYYLINGKIRVTGTNCVGHATIYKNGTQHIIGNYVEAAGPVFFSVVSTVLYLNGSTDYVELYGYGFTSSGNPTFQYIAVGNTCEMSGCLVRAA